MYLRAAFLKTVKVLTSMALGVLCAFGAVPLLAFAALGLSGHLADVSRTENFTYGLQYLGISLAIFGATAGWYFLVDEW